MEDKQRSRDERGEIDLAKAGWILAGIALGGLAAYFFDPVSGRSRRARVRDKVSHYQNEVSWTVGRRRRHLNNQVRGWLAKASQMSHKSSSSVDSGLLQLRVRSELGRNVSHMRSLNITVEDGVVTLRGVILAREVNAVLDCVRSMRGVRDVVNRLEIYEEPGGIPGLQGDGKYASKSEDKKSSSTDSNPKSDKDEDQEI